MKGKEFLIDRVVFNVEKLLKEGYQEIEIKLHDNGFIIIPTKTILKNDKGGQS